MGIETGIGIDQERSLHNFLDFSNRRGALGANLQTLSKTINFLSFCGLLPSSVSVSSVSMCSVVLAQTEVSRMAES